MNSGYKLTHFDFVMLMLFILMFIILIIILVEVVYFENKITEMIDLLNYIAIK